MITFTKQLNILMFISALLILLNLTNINVANAGIIDWLSKDTDKSTLSLSQTLNSFSSLTNFISSSDQKDTDDTESQDLNMLQDSSLVSIHSPVITEKTKVLKILTLSASAYSSTPDQTDSTPFITAWNTHVRDGIIAANFLPFGTKIKIPDIYGDKIFVVEDRMNRRYWHKIDIWFPDRQSALEFGLKTVKIEILES
ncbi:MAG: 3D domain-containing protein [Patescibacteria group bacterium]